MSKIFVFPHSLRSTLPHLSAVLLSAGASILFSNASAQAIETIQLKYYGADPSVPSEVTLTLDEIKEFVRSGELRQQVREFFNINRQDPGPVQRILTEQIYVPSDWRENFEDSSIGRFLLIQLEKLIQSPGASPNLRTALKESIQDDRTFSLLEIIEKYPAEQVTLDVTGLVATYNDVQAFVQRILPTLEAVKAYLQELICECPSDSESGTPQSSLVNDRSATACSTAPAALAPAPESSTVTDSTYSTISSSRSLSSQTPR